MATTTANAATPDPPRVRYRMAPNHDFLLIARELKYRHENDEEPLIICVHEFEVTRKTLEDIEYFTAVFKSNTFADTGRDFYEVKEDNPAALKIWMQLLHGNLDSSSYAVDITTVWHVLIVAHKYGFDALGKEAKGWFKKWYKTNKSNFSITDCRELLYPCYHFDEAEGFAAITKRLAYNNVGHITERRPEGVPAIQKQHRLDSTRVIGALNSARGNLRTKLMGRLYEPSRDLLAKADCKLKEQVFWCYHKALERTGAWPVEIEGSTKSVKHLLDLLCEFKYDDPHPHSKTVCGSPQVCRRSFEAIVEAAIFRCRDQFDGLCLDCMNCSGNEDEDDEYWTHAASRSYGSGFCTGCRIPHRQPTWYFSFLGRREKMNLFQGKDTSKKRGH